jgi:hypothetical protein
MSTIDRSRIYRAGHALLMLTMFLTPAMCGKSPADTDGGGTPPVQECMVAMDCSPPPSSCADSTTLAYYTNPLCQAGKCRWTTQDKPCYGPCKNGGCMFTTTAGGAGGLGGAPPGTGAASGNSGR